MTKKNKTRLEALQAEMDGLYTKISKLEDRIREIRADVREIKLKDFCNQLKKFSIEQGSLFVGFAKRPGYHYDMIQAIQVLEISKNPAIPLLNNVFYTYRVDDSDFSFHTSEKSMTLHQFAEWLDEYTVYKMQPDDFMPILEQMASLKTDFDNVDKLLESVDRLENSNKITL